MKSFSAVFLLQTSVEGDPKVVTRFETYLFDASSLEDALVQAKAYAPRLADRYRNSNGEVVTTVCHGIHGVELIEPDNEYYRGLVSAVELVLPESVDLVDLLVRQKHLNNFEEVDDRPGYPNIDQ